MAESGCARLEQIVTCALCYEVYTSPQTFNCFHSYCQSCVTKLKHDVTNRVPGYTCPLCRRFCAVEDIKPNFLLSELVELHRLTLEGGSVRSCTQCHACDPQWRCLDCKIDFCAECKEGHTRVPLLRGHRLIANEDINEAFLVDKLIFCQIHNDKPLEFNCKVCDQLLCITCKVVDHDCHKTETISTALERMVPTLHTDITIVTSCIEKAESNIAQLVAEKEETKSKFDTIRDTMNKHKEDLINRIVSDHNALLASLNDEETKQIEENESRITAIEDCIKEKRHVITWANTSLQAAQGASLLLEIQGGLSTRLSNMAAENTLYVEAQQNTTNVSFEKHDHFRLESSIVLGKIIITGHENTDNTTNAICDQPQILNSSRFLPFALDHLPNSSATLAQKIQVLEGHLCYRFAIINSELWLPIYNKNCILVYSLDGELIRCLRFGKQIKRPKAVIPGENQDAIICSQTGLFVIGQESGEIQQHVYPGCFSDVAMLEQTLSAFEWKTGNIHIFTFNNPLWDHVRAVDIGHVDRHIGDTLLCVDDSLSDDDVFITCSWQKHHVFEHNSTGALLQTTGGPGEHDPGQLYCPSLCAVDNHGSIFVADCGNHRLQITSNFKLDEKEPENNTQQIASKSEEEQDHCVDACCNKAADQRVEVQKSKIEWKALTFDGLQCPWDVHFQNKNTLWVLNNERFLIQYSLTPGGK